MHIGGEVVSDSKRIRNNYIKGWFALDLISSVPLEMIDMIIEQIDTNEKAVCITTGKCQFCLNGSRAQPKWARWLSNRSIC